MDLTFSEEAERFGRGSAIGCGTTFPDEWRDFGKDADDDTIAAVRRGWGAKLASGGWAAPAWPTEYGGAGLSLEEHAVMLEELVAARAPDAMNSSTIAILGHMIIRHGDERQKHRYLPAMLDHSEVWCQGFSEPEAGSDLAALRTRGTIDGEVMRITGQKLWTTMATFADHCYALVRTTPGSTRHEGISLVLIETDQPGVDVRADPHDRRRRGVRRSLLRRCGGVDGRRGRPAQPRLAGGDGCALVRARHIVRAACPAASPGGRERRGISHASGASTPIR